MTEVDRDGPSSIPLYLQSRLAATPTHSTMTALGEDLLAIVNKLQDLVFNTIGNDSLDLPQIVSMAQYTPLEASLFVLRSTNRI